MSTPEGFGRNYYRHVSDPSVRLASMMTVDVKSKMKPSTARNASYVGVRGASAAVRMVVVGYA